MSEAQKTKDKIQSISTFYVDIVDYDRSLFITNEA